MFLFYVLSFFKKEDTIQGGTLFKEIRYLYFEKVYLLKVDPNFVGLPSLYFKKYKRILWVLYPRTWISTTNIAVDCIDDWLKSYQTYDMVICSIK